MKINELSRLSGVNAETIRSYRLKGLLKPSQLPNGYYEYDMEDFVNLTYLRKLRSYSFTIPDMEQIYHSNHSDHILGIYEREKNQIIAQIRDLNDQLHFLELETKHLMEASSTAVNTVTRLQSIDEKYDFYIPQSSLLLYDISLLRQYYRMGTPTIYLSPEVLNGPCRDKEVPIQVGFGTYRSILQDHHTEISDQAIHIPNGIFLSMLIKLDQLKTINLQQIKPLMDYAKIHHTPFVSGTTGFLASIHEENGKLVYYFRIRACIEENDIHQTNSSL